MRRLVTTVLVTTSLLAGASSAQADVAPWQQYKNQYISTHHLHYPAPPNEMNLAMKLFIREVRHRDHIIWVARQADIRAWKAKLAAEAAARKAQQQQSSPPPSTYHGSLQALVCSFNWSCSIASCIVGRESGWDPNAQNPSGAAGLFQEMPSWWEGKYNPFDPYQNTLHAYQAYTVSGWSSWAGGSYSCGF